MKFPKQLHLNDVLGFALGISLAFAGWSPFEFFGVLHPVGTLLNTLAIIIGPVIAGFSLLVHSRIRPNSGILLVAFGLCLYLLISWFDAPVSARPQLLTAMQVFTPLLILPVLSRNNTSAVRLGILTMLVLVVLMVVIFDTSFVHEIIKGSFGARYGADRDIPLRVARTFLFLALMGLAVVFFDPNRWARLIMLPLSGLLLILGFVCGHRGPIIGFVLALFTFFLPTNMRNNKLKLSLLLLIGLLCGIYFFIMIFMPTTYARFTEVDASMDARLWLYQESVQSISLFGHGYFSLGDYVHNIFLGLLHDHGVIALVVFLVVLGHAIQAAAKIYLDHRNAALLWPLSCLVYYLTVFQFSFSLYNPGIWISVLLPLALYQPSSGKECRFHGKSRADYRFSTDGIMVRETRQVAKLVLPAPSSYYK